MTQWNVETLLEIIKKKNHQIRDLRRNIKELQRAYDAQKLLARDYLKRSIDRAGDNWESSRRWNRFLNEKGYMREWTAWTFEDTKKSYPPKE